MKRRSWVVWLFFITLSSSAWAEDTKKADLQEGSQKPIEVKGQSRNLNMMLVLRNDKDKIKFVKIRENYREEILEKTKKE